MVNPALTEGATKNGQYRDTGNIEHTRHRTKTNKTKTTQHQFFEILEKKNIHFALVSSVET